jgi:hypothetical protein
VLDAIQNTAYATWVRESWGWPFALTFHAFGNAIRGGLIFIICLRLWPVPDHSVYVAAEADPCHWTGFFIQVFSGTTLWVSKPARYLADGLFEWKLIFVLSGAIITYYFQKLLKQEAAGWQASGAVSASGMRLVADNHARLVRGSGGRPSDRLSRSTLSRLSVSASSRSNPRRATGAGFRLRGPDQITA